MEYKVLTQEDIQAFKNIVGVDNALTSELENYTRDTTEELQFFPDIVLKPATTEEVAGIVSYCNENLLPITPRGAGTGLAGGALPVKGGVVLSLERMNKISEIDEKNFLVTVEAGVINFELQEKLEPFGLFYPPDPSSWQSSFIGGNIATNAGGSKAVKYGVTSQYVLNLEVVLADGSIIWTGANTLKNSTGLNLTQLFVGSEGVLGIITKAVLRVLAKPEKDISLLVPFRNMYEACDAVSELFYAGIRPSALEFMEKRAIDATVDFLGKEKMPVDFDIEAHLLISLDESIEEHLGNCVEVVSKFDIGDILFAETSTEKARIWEIRRKVAEVAKMNGYTIEEDTVVPRANLAKLVEKVHKLADENKMKVVCYGHAGDGNLHVRFNHPVHKNSFQVPEIQKILKRLFQIVKELGGTVSGEHGIGLIQRDFLPIVFSKSNLDLQKTIKSAMDPNNILNPGKVIYDS